MFIRQMLTFSLLIGMVISAALVGAEDKPAKAKITIKVAMKDIKAGLHTKVIKGKATDAEKAKLLSYTKALPKLKPPKGSKESWQKLTAALLKATTAAVEGKPGGADALGKAFNCKACHTPHKIYPPKK
ncbi:MAG TPA: hypothetical protein EYN03_09680 [Planctomycetes bacterium]|jgi:hypothetical protein|nr:hypothetical protein [Planctomycetota bacterium]